MEFALTLVLAAAFAVALFFALRNATALAAERERAAAAAREAESLRLRLTEALNGAADLGVQLEARRKELGDKAETLAASEANLRQARDDAMDKRKSLEALEARLTTSQDEKSAVERALATQAETLTQERSQNEEKLRLLREAQEQMAAQFKLLSNSILQAQSETFAKQNKEQVDAVLAPLREKLVEFQTGLAASQTEAATARGALAEQLRQLSEASAGMRAETTNLTRALKGKSQTQGAWGEMILATILEKSGLRKGEEYLLQESSTTEDGERLRPDVIVNLADGRRIVIDAKVSLTAFEAHVNAESDTDRGLQLAAHVGSLRTHIKTLGGKAYQQHVDTGLDYVIMFVPIEGALAVALQDAPGLTGEALASNVTLATPTTLMVALRTVAHLWQVERRNVNAEDIAKRAGFLYEKFVGFIEDMNKLGDSIKTTDRAWTAAMGKLSTGNGNLVGQTQKLKDLGAKTAKSLPAPLLEAAAAEAVPALTGPEDG